MEEIVFHHTLPIQLRFNDVDKFGHVNNTVYFSFYDLGKTEYFASVCPGVDWEKIGIVVVHIEADFVKQIFASDHIAVQTAVSKRHQKLSPDPAGYRHRNEWSKMYLQVCYGYFRSWKTWIHATDRRMDRGDLQIWRTGLAKSIDSFFLKKPPHEWETKQAKPILRKKFYSDSCPLYNRNCLFLYLN